MVLSIGLGFSIEIIRKYLEVLIFSNGPALQNFEDTYDTFSSDIIILRSPASTYYK
jgi:hypothetical protein